MEKILLYGMGKEFQRIIRQNNWLSEYTDIIAIVDRGKAGAKFYWPETNKTVGVIGLADMDGIEYRYIVITTTAYYTEVVAELTDMGIGADTIISIGELWAHCIFDGKDNGKLKGLGVDIGGPSVRFFGGIYQQASGCDIVNYSNETIWSELGTDFSYDGKKLGNVIINDAVDLHDIRDDIYDFILSSNNLEHIANPLKALQEWKRILKKGGLMIIAVPDQHFTFDHRRKPVDFRHLLDDYIHDVKEDDLTHLEEILEYHDLTMDKAAGTFEAFRERSWRNYENRCLHHHIFHDDVLLKLAEYLQMEVLVHGMLFEANLIIVMRK